MSRFAESPVPYLLIGLALESVLLILYVHTRRLVCLVSMAVIAALTLVGIAFEQLTITDREAVEQTVYALAEAIEADNTPGVLSFISLQAQKTRADAAREMNHYEVELARVISDLQIDLHRQTSPPTAHVEFRALVRVQEGRSGLVFPGTLDFVLTFGKEGERWMLLGYAYEIVR